MQQNTPRPGTEAPASRRPVDPGRPGLVAVPPPERHPASGPGTGERDRLRENLGRVLAGLRWPAVRWQVLAEAEAWGVSGVIRQQLVPLPDGRYPSLEAVVEVLSAVARGRLRTGPPGSATGADRRYRAVVRQVVPTSTRPAAVRRAPVSPRRHSPRTGRA